MLNGQIQIGAEFGVNSGRYNHSDLLGLTSSNKTDFYIAAHSRTQLSDLFSLGFDVDFRIKRFGVNGSATVPTAGEEIFRIRYIDFNPYLIYDINRNISLGLGSYLGLNFKAEYLFVDDIWDDISELDVYSDVDYGLLVNARFTMNRFTFKVEYNYGLKDISMIQFTNFSGQILGEGDQRYRNLQIGLAYYLYSSNGEY